MQNVQENIELSNLLKHSIKEHPMCFDFKEYPNEFVVIFPYPSLGVNGIRITKDRPNKTMLQILLDKLEKAWEYDNVSYM